MRRRSYFVKGFIICSILAVIFVVGYSFLWVRDGVDLEQSKVQKQQEIQELLCTSGVSSEECRLCGSIAYQDSIEDNLGIILVNSGELIHVAINRYDASGQPIEESAGYLSNDTVELTGDFKMSFMVNADRGYARAKIVPEKVVDKSKAAEYYCTDCLNSLFKDVDIAGSYGIGLVHFATGEVRILDTHIRGFMLGDYYVSCNVYEKEGKDTEVEILIFYCPERFDFTKR